METQGIILAATDATRHNIASALGASLWRFWMYKAPFLLAYQAASRIENGKARYEASEGNTAIY